MVAIDQRGQFILRTKNDARRERIRQLEDQLSIYWILLGGFQAIAIFSLGDIATRHLSRTASALMQQNWTELYYASVMLSLFVTGLMLFLCGVLVRLGCRQMAWLGVLTSLAACVIA
ncbi:MAG: hypothetical protein C0478_13040, partial [Planctomyces sp.]|nr:hypothetical protein [Planctomyces sp.]